MRLTPIAGCVALSLLGACSDPPQKETAPNNTASQNQDPNVRPNNVECGFRHCPGDCLDDGWCVVDTHSPVFYVAFWVESPDEIWIADQGGNVRVGAGTTWEDRPVPGIDQLSDIIGDGSGNVWVTTHPPGIQRWDGSEWVPEPIDVPLGGTTHLAHDTVTDTLFAANSEAIYERVDGAWEVHAKVDAGTMQNVANCDGTRWFAAGFPTTIENGRAVQYGIPAFNWLQAATVLPTGEVVAGGDRVIFYDGQYKSTATTFLNRTDSLTGTSLDDIWAHVPRLNASEVWHFDGVDWTLTHEYGTREQVGSVYTDTPGQLRVTFRNGNSVLLDGDGTELEQVESPPGAATLGPAYPAHHVSLDEYWVFTRSLYRWTQNDDWDSGRPGPSGAVAMWGASVDDVWFLNERGEISRTDAEGHVRVDPGFPLSENLERLTGTDAGHVWFVGTDQVVEWDGTTWREHTDFDEAVGPDETTVAVVAVDDQAWVFRGDHIFRWDGARWNHHGPQRKVASLGCEGNDLVGIASYPPAVLREPLDWMAAVGDLPAESETSAWRSWMTSEDDAWVITHQLPKLHRWDGDAWVTSLENPQAQLKDIQVLPTGEVYILGDKTVFVR